MLADQAAFRVTQCASAGTSYPPISTPTVIPPTGDTCITGYTPGRRHTTYTLPYNLSSILPLISSFRDISWTGAQLDASFPAASSLPLNGTNNEPGTARAYTLADGATVVETLLEYTRPSDPDGNGGQYIEVHSIAPLYQPLDPDDSLPTDSPSSTQYDPPNGTFGLYSAHDSMRVASSCGGAATTFNLTATFCATNVSAAERWFRARDTDAIDGLGRRLGGGSGTGDVTDCADVVVATGGGGAAGGSGAAPTPSAASHQQTRMTMGTAVSLVLGACMAFAALMA